MAKFEVLFKNGDKTTVVCPDDKPLGYNGFQPNLTIANLPDGVYISLADVLSITPKQTQSRVS